MNPYAGPRKKTNGLAIASLVIGLASIVLCQAAVLGFVGLLAIVLGIIGLRQIKDRGDDGRSLAIAGIVTGVIGTALAILVTILIGGVLLGASRIPATTRYRPPTTYSTTPTTREHVGGPTTTTTPRPRGAGVIAAADCTAANSSLRTLMQPQMYDEQELTASAATLHSLLPSSYSDDIDTILLDGLNRTSVPSRPGQTSPSPPANVLGAQQRVAGVVLGDCP